MNLAIFDLDNTLLNGDSDHAWGEFLVIKGLMDGDEFRQTNDHYYDLYLQGQLDIMAYLEFALKPLTQFSMSELAQLHDEFMDTMIKPMVTEQSRQLLEKHRSNDDYLLIITATNDFVTQPIADFLGVHDLIATQAEKNDQGYTGKVSGTPSFQAGKITRLNDWLNAREDSFTNTYFYSDSANDIPLLEFVDYPFAVDPDDRLKQHANDKGWPVISLRDE